MRSNYMTYGMAARLSAAITGGLLTFFLLLSLYLRNLFDISPENDTLSVRMLIEMIAFGTTMMFLLLFGLFCINFRIMRGELSQKRKIVAVISCSILFTVAFSTSVALAQGWLLPRGLLGPTPAPFILIGIFRDLFLATFVVFISQIIYLNQKRRQVERRNDQLEAENLRTRYQALKNQLNPHFLFNTLSTLDAMIDIDPGRSREYVRKFSSVFRYTLKNNDVVTLGDELEFVRNYTDLMQIRHGAGLRIKFAVDPRFESRSVVPMAVQGLVENAIKHNSFSDSDPLVITVATTPEGELTVSNRFSPRKYPEPGEGVGLANLAERYRLNRREITVSNSDGIFMVSLPLISPQS